jgi:hypothetical protein
MWSEWGLTVEEEEELLYSCTAIDASEFTVEEEEELLCTCISEDLLRSGPSGRMCQVEDVRQLTPGLPTLRVRDDLFEGVSPEIECIPPPLIDIMVVEEDDDSDIEWYEPDIIYIKTVENIDISTSK